MKMIEIEVDRLEPNVAKIEEALVLANGLIRNHIGIYHLLHCFKGAGEKGYDLRHCFETCPSNVFGCFIEFIERGYLIQK